MSTSLLVAIIIAAAVVVVVVVLAGQRLRTRRLREQFGPEYERTLARTGDRRAGESELADREQRHRRLEIVDLDPADRTRYLEAWRATQGRFVDDPAGATREADELVSSVMRDRGYPVDEFEQRVGDISVDHPQVAENYRAAHAVSLANERGLASTDDLRQAFVHYRSLFAELLDSGRDTHTEEVR
ncbi:MAG TPA: hypothetical protein VE776_14115 [Actinomycetota bacterium]|nr:hypothetical protein [Actinomycetota bacterium]